MWKSITRFWSPADKSTDESSPPHTRGRSFSAPAAPVSAVEFPTPAPAPLPLPKTPRHPSTGAPTPRRARGSSPSPSDASVRLERIPTSSSEQTLTQGRQWAPPRSLADDYRSSRSLSTTSLATTSSGSSKGAGGKKGKSRSAETLKDDADLKRSPSLANLRRNASTVSLKMKRTFSSKSVFADALSHGSSSHVHLVAPPLPTPPLHTARSSPNLVADLWSSAHPALVPAASAFRIAEALIASGSPSLAIPHLHQAAYGGHSEAQYTIAVFYTQGIPNHLQPNHALAVCYYRLAATQGHAPASCNLGVMFSNGMGGLVKDDVQAFEWFGRSAEGGFAEGMWNLGRAHWAKGELREARRWFAKAADKGCEGARTFVRKLRQREDLDKHYPDVWKASPLRGEDDAGAGRGGLKRTMGPLPQPNTVPRQLMPVM